MKSIKKYIGFSALALSLALVSCNDFLDKDPDSRMELSSPEDCSKLLVTAYPETNATYLLEMYSDNTDYNDKTGFDEYTKFQGQAYNWADITETSDNEAPQYLWTTHYAAVATANKVLDYIDHLPQAEQEAYKAQRGEAYACRAFAMFQLANVFCMAYDKTTANQYMGLPYPKDVDETIDREYDRGTLAELYANIEKDILAATQLVTNDYAQPKYHFTQSALYAFAERFYLYYQNYDEAINYANKVLGTSNPTSYLRDWKTWAGLSVSGQILPNAFVNSSNKANLLLQVVYSMWGAIGGAFPSVGNKYAHDKAIAEDETLLSVGVWGSSSTNLNYTCLYNTQVTAKYMMSKIPYSFEYYDVQANTGVPHAVYAVFTTDIALIERAEAYALKGEYQKAVQDINWLLAAFSNTGKSYTLDRIKSYYTNLKYYTPSAATPKKEFHTSFDIEKTTQEPVLDCILHLKRILTIHEGFRLQDVKRYGMTMYRRRMINDDQLKEVTDTMKAGDPRLAIQLPQDVIKVGLPANPRNNK